MLSLYRRLIELRRREPALAVGRYEAIPAPPAVLAYRRSQDERSFVVVLNLSHENVAVALPGFRGRVALSTGLDRKEELVSGGVELRPDEGVVAEATADGPGDL
jgi:alpha-glucosidase